MNASLILFFPHSNASYEVEPDEEIVAGLSEVCDINLRRFFGGPRIKTISRLHFKLVYLEESGYAIVDLFSTNGTRVNDRALQPGVPRFLRNGDYITLANSEEFVISVVTDVSSATEIFADMQPEAASGSQSREDVGLRYIHGLDQFVVDGTAVPHAHLSPLEHSLLRFLYNRAGRVCSYDELATQVWGYKRYDKIENNTIAKTVSNLRKKLDGLSQGSGERYIATVHGRGVKCLLLPE
jgi:hypothetical protein